MAQQIINTGNVANDGTGESLRDAFTAVNQNFTEIYTAGPVGSNVVISGNTITVTGTNNNVVLAGNGIGNIQANSSIQPSIDAVYNIGGPNSRFNTVYAASFVGNGAGLTGITANVGPIISNADSNVRVLSNAVTMSVQTQPNVVVIGRFNSTFRGNLLPDANVTYNIGSPSLAWNDLYLSGNTIFLNTATIQSNATAITITNQLGGQFVLDGTGTFSNESIFNGLTAVDIPTANGNITMRVGSTPNVAVVSTAGMFVTGQISASGNITGAYIFGNGSQLTGLPESYSNANVAAFLPIYNGLLSGGSANIATTITAGGAISAAGQVQGSSISVAGNVTAAALNATSLSLSGNVISNIQTGGTVTANRVSATGPISTTGNVTGQFLFGDGGFISNITVSGNISASQLGNGSTVLSVGGPGGPILGTVGGTANILDATTQGIFTVGNVSATGNVSGNYFIGNGRFLTGLSPNSIYNGLSEVNIGVANGNVNVNIGSTSNVLVIAAGLASVTGNITATGNVTANNATIVNAIAATTVDAATMLADSMVTSVISSGDSSQIVVNDGLLVNGDIDTNGQVSASGNILTNNTVLALAIDADEVLASNVAATSIAADSVSANSIQSLGTISAVGNITGGNLIAEGTLTATEFVGDLKGSVFADDSSVMVDAVDNRLFAADATISGNLNTANLNATAVVATTVTATGNVTAGNVLAPAGLISAAGNVLANNVGALQSVTGTVISATGNVIGGNVTAVATVSAAGNVEAGNVNAVTAISTTGNVQAANVVGTTVSATGNVIGALVSATGNVEAPKLVAATGVYGNIFTTLIDSDDSSAITVTPDTIFQASVDIENDLTVAGLAEFATVSAQNVQSAGTIHATGNITTEGFFVGNFAGNITGNLTVPGSNTQVT